MQNQNFMPKEQNPYYIGVDIGTNSVGYAVTDTDYKPCKFKGEPMLGVTLFDDANQCDNRRAFRSARRRLDRRQQRVNLIQELFAEEIEKVDPTFFVRIKESSLLEEDRSEDALLGLNWDNEEYKKKFPTIHHLICKLMQSSNETDIRHIYLAVAWLVAHRGHFLYEIDSENVEDLTNITHLYKDFEDWFDDNDYEKPWSCKADEFEEILRRNMGVIAKERKLTELLFDGKKPKDNEDEYIHRSGLLRLFAGGSVDVKKLFSSDEYKDISEKICLGDADGIEALMPILGDDAEIIKIISRIYDSAKLSESLDGQEFISQAKVKQYEEHKNDLKQLKKLIRKYCDRSVYGQMFRKSQNNYSSYVGNFKSYQKEDEKKKTTREEFYKSVKDVLSKINPENDTDRAMMENVYARIDTAKYMPKQVNPDNRLIPYQLYYAELKIILKKAEDNFEFLSRKDCDGLSVSDKIKSVFKFRVPYYVGPLVSEDKSKYAWLERKANGRILPWNFEEMVDLDACEDKFINRMTNKCTYLPNCDVLPKNSIIYSKAVILNLINNININSVPIAVEWKQKMFEELFKKRKKVTYKDIVNFLRSENILRAGDEGCVGGIDKEFNCSFKAYYQFRNLISSKLLSEEEVEQIISRRTCTESNMRFRKWFDKWCYENGKQLSEEDVQYVTSMKFSDFGSLSLELLNGMEGSRKDTGDTGTVMYFLWNTNDNLSKILTDTDKYNFSEIIAEKRREYYSGRPKNLGDRLEEMGISNAVKRPVIRTIDIISDIVKAKKYPPAKIFVEMARGATKEQKERGRTVQRKDQLLEIYQNFDPNEINEIRRELENLGDDANQKLQKESLYLYFVQRGKCMYCGKRIDDINECNIDHIWPQWLIKDDSIHNNKVLVHSDENGIKGDKYPLPAEWRSRMMEFWQELHDKKAINDEKFARLTRSTEFTDDEKMGFINRQMVETRQSTKAVTQILQEYYPSSDTRVVFVKAGNVSNFRHKYGEIKNKAYNLNLSKEEMKDMCLVKSRSANDIHHAYDAYLNIVVGNVYDERFSKKFFDISKEKYTLNPAPLFGNPWDKNPSVWNPEYHLPIVDKVMANQNVRLTKYQLCQKSGQNGGFYDQQILAAYRDNGNLIPLKNGMDTEKYGGYSKPTISFFVLVRYKSGKKYELNILPVQLLVADKFLNDEKFAEEYIKSRLGEKATEITRPLGKRILKINTVFSLDGFVICLAGKDNGKVLMRSLMTPRYTNETLAYIKRIEKVSEKNKDYKIDEKYDGITKEKNIILYDYIAEKINGEVYSKMPGSRLCVCDGKREIFESLDIKKQLECLENLILYLKTNRPGSIDMGSVDGKGTEGRVYISGNISNWAKKYKDVRIIDRSASGLFEKTTDNLLELLK